MTPLLFCHTADSDELSHQSLSSPLLCASLDSVLSSFLAHTSSFYSAHVQFAACPEFEIAAEIFLLRAETQEKLAF